MSEDQQLQRNPISPERPDSPVTIELQRRKVNAYLIFSHEIDSLGAASKHFSLYAAFLGMAFGGAVSLWITLSTVDILSPKTNAIYWAISVLFTILTIVFAALSYFSWSKSQDQIKEIRERSGEKIILPNK